MRIALIGYGKMGKIIEEIAISRGHEITGYVSSSAPIESIDFTKVDVAIEFSTPDSAVKHIEHSVSNATPIVVGTTAWNKQLPEVTDFVTKNNGALLYASNFSIGVNIFFDINRRLAQLMANHDEYTAYISETHHVHKIDAPSGTAVNLANDILTENPNIRSWVHKENAIPEIGENQIGVVSYRKPDVPGTHEVTYESTIDTLQIKHTAHSRAGFAIGAVIAAEWLQGKTGVYTMRDVINL